MKHENDLKLPKGFFRAVTKCKDKKAAYNAVVALSRIEVPETLFRLATTVSEILSRVAKTRDSIPKFDTDNKTNNIQIITKKAIAQYHFIEPADFDNIVLQIVEAIHKKADKLSRKYADQLIKDKIQEINERIDEPDNTVTDIDEKIRSENITIKRQPTDAALKMWVDSISRVTELQAIKVDEKEGQIPDIVKSLPRVSTEPELRKGYLEIRERLDKYLMPLFETELGDKIINNAWVTQYYPEQDTISITISMKDKENAHSKEAE